MSINLYKINDLLANFASQGNQASCLSPLDYFMFGYMLSTLSSRPNFLQYAEELFKKIIYINDLYKNQIFSFNQKMTLLQEILDNPIEKCDRLIEKAMDKNFDIPLKKAESQEESKLSEEYILKLIEEEEKRKKQDEEFRKKEEAHSEEIAKRIQEEEKQNAEFLRELKENEIDQNIECQICLTSLFSENQEVWGLVNCQHCFHKTCLNPYLESEISQKKFPIKCPMEYCKAEIQNEDLMENLEKEALEKYWEFTLKNYVELHGDELSWCPTADCNYAFIFDKEIYLLHCPKCMKSYCLNCRVEEHKGMSCKEYQINSKVDHNDVMFYDFVKGHKFKKCTQCQFWVEKNEGCDHMTCRCGYQFCYICGGKYMACECKPGQPRVPIMIRPAIPVNNYRHPVAPKGGWKKGGKKNQIKWMDIKKN